MALALVEAVHRFGQHRHAHLRFFGLGDGFVLQRTVIRQPVLPFARAFLAPAHRRVERAVAAHHHAPVHVDHVLLGHAEIGRDLGHVSGAEIGVLVGFELLFHAAQVEEQLLLRSGGAHFHKAPRTQDELLDRGLDPPHRVGREAEAAIGLELLDALHQADIAFGNEIGDRQTIAAVTHRDLRDETQVRRHQLGCGFGILVFLIALGEHVFLLGGQHREFSDFGQIAVEALLAA